MIKNYLWNFIMHLEYLIGNNFKRKTKDSKNTTLDYALDNTRMSCVNKDYKSILDERNQKNKIIKKF